MLDRLRRTFNGSVDGTVTTNPEYCSARPTDEEVPAVDTVAGRPLVVTLSAGAAQLLPGETMTAWLHRADQALYEAKRGGRNRVAASFS